nr:BTAD domain-containing putative transcriptional regulator [Actinophytocola oryzae]
MTFRVLGPLAASDERGQVDLRGPRHRAVLARLLVARRRVVPVGQLVSDLWPDPPGGAVGAVQTFVAALRKALEPDRPPRTPARLLVTSGPGYALHAESVDAWDLEAAVGSTGSPQEVLARVAAALDSWRGPAYADFADEPWARGEIARLDELRALAVERRASALLDVGRAAAAVPDLEAHVDGSPLREDAWRLLALARYQAGRQGDALETLRRARAVLAEELGVDPGPALRQVEADILAQAPAVAPHGAGADRNADVVARGADPGAGSGTPGTRGAGTGGLAADGEDQVIRGAGVTAGRAGDVAARADVVASGADRVAAGGRVAHGADLGADSGDRVVGGADPVAGDVVRVVGRGSGPGDLVARSAGHETDGTDLLARGALFVGRGGELAGLSAAAAEVVERGRMGLALVAGEAGAGKTALAEAFSARLGWTTAWGDNPDDEGLPAAWPWTRILDGLPRTAPSPEAGGDPAVARFHWHRAVATYLAGHAPLLLVLDDLHWAGEETLALLASLPDTPGAVLIVATYRTTDVPGRLAAFLGRVARAEPTRVYLGGLSVEAVTTMVGDRADAAAIHRRSGGNPFFVRELTRLLTAGGDLSSVPAGVRDVVRHRLATLPADVVTVLRHAAVLGADVDLDLLPGDVLDALEAATERGFLVEAGAGRFRFAHALVRDTLYQDLSRSRRARWHATVAAALERSRPDDVEALAHHYLHAGDAARGVPYARTAAERAERRFAPHHAARLWRAALDRVSADSPERLALLMGLVRNLAVSGDLAAARRLRAEALDLAEAVADPSLTARVIAAFDVPASWPESDDPALARRIVSLTERTLASGAHAPAVRSRLLSTIALEARNAGGERAHEAAEEAEAVARTLDDPAVLAFALNARFMQSFATAGGAPTRLRIGTELVALATRHALVAFEVLGHLIVMQANAALADVTAADHHADAAERLGEDYEIPLVSVLIDGYRAMRAGDPVLYRAAATRLAGAGMPGMSEGILGLALLCERVRRGEQAVGGDFGAYEPWCRPLVLLAAGDVAGARAVEVPPSPRDLLFEARTCLHALSAIELDDRETMTRLHRALAPAADEVAGAGSGLVTLGPVADYLARLATALSRPPRARAARAPGR